MSIYINKLVPKRLNNSSIREVVRRMIRLYGKNVDLTSLDVSHVSDFSHLFEGLKFNGDISMWNMSNAEDISFMFCGGRCVCDISAWDLSNVKYANFAFFGNTGIGKQAARKDFSSLVSADTFAYAHRNVGTGYIARIEETRKENLERMWRAMRADAERRDSMAERYFDLNYGKTYYTNSTE